MDVPNDADLPELRKHIRAKRAALAGFMELGAALALNGDVLRVIPSSHIYVRYLNDNRDSIAELAAELYGCRLRVVVDADAVNLDDKPAPEQSASVAGADGTFADGAARDRADNDADADPAAHADAGRYEDRDDDQDPNVGGRAKPGPLRANPAEIRRALSLLCESGEVYELRSPPISGYFDDLQRLANSAIELGNDLRHEAVYITLNPVDRILLSRADNSTKYSRDMTGDKHVARRRRLLIDCDAQCPASGISSTDEEHEAALARSREITAFLRARGLPEPLFADSGNGGHLVHAIDLPNDAESTKLCERVLKALDFQFSDQAVKVDRTTYNASRISKLYGTPVRKGSSMPDRPHRLSRILEAPDKLKVVSREQLEEIAALLTAA